MTMLKRLSASSMIVIALAVAAYALHAQTAQPQVPAPKPAGAPTAAPAQGPRPEQFKFPPLAFTPPKPAEFRATLSNGLVVYIAEDHEIPWFDAALLTPVAGGGGGGGRGRGVEDSYELPQGPPGGGGGARSFLEPKDKLGIQNLTGSVMRSGGTTSMTADQVNERMEFLAGTVSPTSCRSTCDTSTRASRSGSTFSPTPRFPRIGSGVNARR
jgi:glucose/arabinose dehydrogenase